MIQTRTITTQYSQPGSHIYIGQGGVENVDWSAPLAFVPEGSALADVSVSLTPHQRYTMAARRVSACGVEEHNTHVIMIVETDEAGVLQPSPLPRPFDVSFERVNAGTIRLGFTCEVPPGFDEPTEYRIYSDGGSGAMDYETPIVSITEHVAGRREFVVALSVLALPTSLAVQAWRGSRCGPVSSILVISESASPLGPTMLPYL